MRALPAILFLGLAVSASAQVAKLPVVPRADRDLKAAMIVELADPKTQVAIGVTSTQRASMELRLIEDSTNMTFDAMRAALNENDDTQGITLEAMLTHTPSRALYPYLAENQIAKLRRLTLAHQPLAALGTDEVAFALTLSEAQRKRIEAIRVAYNKGMADPSRPSVRLVAKAFAKLSADAAKLAEDGGDAMTVEKIDAFRPLLAGVFRAIGDANRLSAKEPPVKTADPLKLLTVPQRRRYNELAGIATVAFTPSAYPVVKG